MTEEQLATLFINCGQVNIYKNYVSMETLLLVICYYYLLRPFVLIGAFRLWIVVYAVTRIPFFVLHLLSSPTRVHDILI